MMLSVKGLHTFYGKIHALKGIDLEINEGEIVTLVGSNGAGKSTTIKMLTGILKPTSGNICINGLDPYKNRIQSTKNIGVVFGQRTQRVSGEKHF